MVEFDKDQEIKALKLVLTVELLQVIGRFFIMDAEVEDQIEDCPFKTCSKELDIPAYLIR